nr:hypothetical protein CFP56_01109 [Quercus suber]
MSYRPEVVDEDVEDAQNHDEDDRAPLRLESNHHHDACHSAQHDDEDSTHTPLPCEDKTDEQENQEHSPGELEVHFAILFVKLGEASRSESFADPRIGKYHEQTAHDRKIAQEKVQVEDQAVTQRLCDDHADEPGHGIFAVPTDDDQEGRCGHGEHIDDEEEVCQTGRDYRLIRILQERDHDQEPPNGRKVWLDWVRDGVQPVLNLAESRAEFRPNQTWRCRDGCSLQLRSEARRGGGGALTRERTGFQKMDQGSGARRCERVVRRVVLGHRLRRQQAEERGGEMVQLYRAEACPTPLCVRSASSHLSSLRTQKDREPADPA